MLRLLMLRDPGEVPGSAPPGARRDPVRNEAPATLGSGWRVGFAAAAPEQARTVLVGLRETALAEVAKHRRGARGLEAGPRSNGRAWAKLVVEGSEDLVAKG
jgi:hypothetical protein